MFYYSWEKLGSKEQFYLVLIKLVINLGVIEILHKRRGGWGSVYVLIIFDDMRAERGGGLDGGYVRNIYLLFLNKLKICMPMFTQA